MSHDDTEYFELPYRETGCTQDQWVIKENSNLCKLEKRGKVWCKCRCAARIRYSARGTKTPGLFFIVLSIIQFIGMAAQHSKRRYSLFRDRTNRIGLVGNLLMIRLFCPCGSQPCNILILTITSKILLGAKHSSTMKSAIL